MEILKKNKFLSEDFLNALQLLFALLLLSFGLLAGAVASQVYAKPEILHGHLPAFIKWRPLHTSSVILFIIISAQSLVNICIYKLTGKPQNFTARIVRTILLIFAVTAVFYHYFTGHFGGREYWEFPRYLSAVFLAVWILQLASVLSRIRLLNAANVYVWMWTTGSVFLVLIFMENYFWIFPSIHQTAIKDLLVQWKSAGSMVGAWNQMVYGLAMYAMTRITKNDEPAKNKTAFVLYFLGLTNLMFNWGHHIYTLPSEKIVRIISYSISMTEWILFIRIMYYWPGRKGWREAHTDPPAGLFFYASEIWVMLNLFLALLISIPAINIYTHGTHITVAHSMGTTIGINTMILLGTAFYLFPARHLNSKYLLFLWYFLQISLFVFWVALIIAGIVKGQWMLAKDQTPYSTMMQSLHPWFMVFAYTGITMTICLWLLIFSLAKNIIFRPKENITA